MYSGTTIRRGSGKIIGTHQKIDRVARRKLQQYLPRVSVDSDSKLALESVALPRKILNKIDPRNKSEDDEPVQNYDVEPSRRKLKKAMKTSFFPTSREIVKFEGLDGPDGIKKKSPARDEPWHYINPADENDREILDLIHSSEQSLIRALSENNREKAAFEAAWLSHAIVDGLTPAHHYPYKEKRDELLGDRADIKATVLKKILTSGDNWHEKLKNNYEFFKPNGRGVISAHFYFEIGVAMITASVRFSDVKLSRADRLKVQQSGGITPLYLDIVKRIYNFGMYDEFLRTSWTPKLARLTKNELMPIIIHTVLMSWYYCAWKSNQNQTSKKHD